EGELTEAEVERAWYGQGPARPPVGRRPEGPTRPRPVRPPDRNVQEPVPPGGMPPPGDVAGPGDMSAGGEPAAPSLVRSSSVMALGTLASRLSGLVRSVVLVYALGVQQLGNAYNNANTLPNTVYNLARGGILTSVIVPLLVSAAKRHRDRGEQYDQRMFTLITVALAGITLIGTLAAAPIASLYDPTAKAAEHHLLVIFAYFFIPQIFFYGVSSLAGAVLNARGHFAAPMWTPVVNNIVVTVMAVAFLVVASGQNVNEASTVTNGEILLLGIGTTLGIIAQTAALIPALRRVRFRWHPRFDFRRVEIAEIGRMAGWMFCYVLTTQVAFLVTSRVASTAGNADQTGGVGAGFTAYTNAWLLFQLPYAIVAISVITALLPRMSAHVSDRRFDLVQADFSTGVRLGSVVVAPAALVLAAIGPALGEVLLGWGNTSDASARYMGLVFSVFSLGLVPYMLFRLLLRVFYALHDSKTAALIGVATMVANVGANLIALAAFPKSEVVAALGAGFGLANAVGAVLAWRVLSRRLGGLAGREIGRSLLRMHEAAVPAALFALIVSLLITSVFSTAKIYAALIVVVGGAGALLIYVVAAKKLRVTEVTDLMGMVRARVRR
ncbi:MAG: murein biosynthesis integral membrane protein MurJ, partial [Streptosporangiaceae bacterium]